MGATFSRIKNWIAEILTYADLNAEINNILNNLGPAGVDDYSSTVTEMRITTDPGEVGTESQATSLAGELARLRFEIKAIKGSDAAQWYSGVSASLTDLIDSVGGSLQTNRIVSGAMSANSTAPRFLVPAGSAATLTLDGTPTNFVYYINGTQYTISSDVQLTSLSAAPSSNNTALVNDTFLSGQETSKWAGEDGTNITIDNVGTEISNLTGKYAAFKIVSGANTEYFIGYVHSATQLRNCMRGYFFDSTLARVPRIAISDNDTITLMNLSWVFATTTSILAVSYVNPSISYTAPSSTLGYWFDIANQTWKTWNGSAWVSANATLIGICIQDTSNCKAARAFNFHAAYDSYSNIILNYGSATTLISRDSGSKISVGSSLVNFGHTKPIWDITQNLESGYTETVSTTYFAYIGESGQIKLSPEKPYRENDITQGWYHPYENWRAVGYIQNDSASDFDMHTSRTYMKDPIVALQNIGLDADSMRNIGFSASVSSNALTIQMHGADGLPLSPGNPGYITFRHSTATTGINLIRRLVANISITVPSGATLGHTSGVDQYIWAYALDNAGTLDIGVMGVDPLNDMSIASSTQVSAGSTSGSVLYSAGTAISNKSIRLVGRFTSNQTAAGTWATGISTVLIKPTLNINMTNWANNAYTFTPSSAAFGNISAHQTLTRRMGDSLEVKLYWRNGTAGAATASVTLPFTMDSTKIPGGGFLQDFGSWYANRSDASTTTYSLAYVRGSIAAATSSLTTVFLCAEGESGAMKPLATANTIPGGTSAGMVVLFTLPIKGWSVFGP